MKQDVGSSCFAEIVQGFVPSYHPWRALNVSKTVFFTIISLVKYLLYYKAILLKRPDLGMET